ncbi:hypothetical protein ONZ43_g6466 [Nemania bipapillata]|uniref:Uncharacterized protein n=1 Tax=Nemania bipapillata TaxID=110536 RepID=A0ACC2HZU9_9PEZI|nr:hypothetical protein ONZ43_g6466 [Nemania bipapillata]
MDLVQWYQLPFTLVTPSDVLGAGIALPLASLGIVATRFYIRTVQKAAPGLDDWCILIGAIFITFIGAGFITGERLGVMGYPTPLPSGANAAEAYGLFLNAYILLAKLQFAIQFLMVFAYGFVKASIVLFCRRIFVSHKGSAFDWASKTVMVLIILWSAGFLIGALILGCGKSVELHWAPLQVIEQSGCDTSTPEIALVISDLILDLLIIMLPLPAIWALNMSRKRKFAVTGIFLVGLTSISASAARAAIYLVTLYEGYNVGYDIDRVVTTLLWWSLLEITLAAIAACLPTLGFLRADVHVQRFFSKMGSMSSLPGSWRSRKGSSSQTRQQTEDTFNSLPGAHSLPNQKASSESQLEMGRM